MEEVPENWRPVVNYEGDLKRSSAKAKAAPKGAASKPILPSTQSISDLMWPVGPDGNRHVKDCAFVRFDEGVCECDKELPEEQAALLQLALSCLPEKITPENTQLIPPSNSAGYKLYCDGHNATIDTIEQNMRRAFS